MSIIDHKTFAGTSLFDALHKLDNSPTVFNEIFADKGPEVLRHNLTAVNSGYLYNLDYNFMPVVPITRPNLATSTGVYAIDSNTFATSSNVPCTIVNVVAPATGTNNTTLVITKAGAATKYVRFYYSNGRYNKIEEESLQGNKTVVNNAPYFTFQQTYDYRGWGGFRMKIQDIDSGEVTVWDIVSDQVVVAGKAGRVQALSGHHNIDEDFEYCLTPVLKYPYGKWATAQDVNSGAVPAISKLFNSVLSTLSKPNQEAPSGVVVDRNTKIDTTVVVNSPNTAVKWRLYFTDVETYKTVYQEYSITEAKNLWSKSDWLKTINLPFPESFIYSKALDSNGEFIDGYHDIYIAICHKSTLCDLSAYQANMIATGIDRGILDSSLRKSASQYYCCLGYPLSSQIEADVYKDVLKMSDDGMTFQFNALSACLNPKVL